MPRRDDIHSIMVIGSGPIVIGQACEFDYSGTQACQVLRAEGFKVILVNSNPATIMTDPATADVTYVEPLDPDVLTEVIAARPEAIATAEDRELFKEAMADIGLAVPKSGFARSVEEAFTVATDI